MKKLVETSKHEADGADRRIKVHKELIFAGGGLTDEEIVKVGGIITADCNKTDIFSHWEGISRSFMCTACFKRGFSYLSKKKKRL